MFGDWLERPLRSKTDRPLALAHMQVSALILAATFGSMLTPYGPKLDMYSASLASSMKL
jgi:hypothetical protein